ncbi:hypothetical protein ACP0HM_14025 [Escherichia coli]
MSRLSRNNYAHWDRLLSLVNMRHIFFNDYCPDGCGWQGCHVWHCWVACRITISQPLIRQQKKKIPVYQLADYLSTECSDIWALQGKINRNQSALLAAGDGLC